LHSIDHAKRLGNGMAVAYGVGLGFPFSLSA